MASELKLEANTVTKLEALQDAISSVVRGKRDLVHDFLTAVLAGGSVLLEDLPGVGKTTLAKTFAQCVDLQFQRLQCTPDLLPADVFGFSMFRADQQTFEFRPGPVFTNVLLVDEVNRASPRTQSALLEAMAERQVTIEGTCRELPEPFFVIATQNPMGFQGTYPLPEAQLDRFLYLLNMDYPDFDSEIELLYDQSASKAALTPVLSGEELVQLQRQVEHIEVHRDIGEYLIRIVQATRDDPRIQLPASPRASQMMFRAAQANAVLSGRDYVIPDDVQHVAPLTLAHRIVPKRGARDHHQSKRTLVQELVSAVPVPV